MDNDCLFCRIVAGDIPATVVHETDTTLSFRDIGPKAPVHVLVIPKDHHPDVVALARADPAAAADVLAAAAAVAEQEGLVGDGFLSGSTRLLPVLRTVASGTLLGPVPNNLVVWALVAAGLIFGLSRTGLGRSIYAVGDNPVACRLAGVRIWQVLLAVYLLSALLAALGGLLFSGISGSVGPDQTNAYLLPSVAAAVIGGTSILGGVGGYTGTILGALILTVLNRLLLTLDTTEAFRQILYGLIVLALAWVYVRVTGQRGS